MCRWGAVCVVFGVTAALAASGASRAAAAGMRAADAVQTKTVSVWDGVYSEEQARRGARAYTQECSSCHHDDLRGEGPAPALVGTSFFFRWSDLSVDDMLTATRTTMPQGAPGSLSQQTYLDIVAYLLKANGIPAGASDLPKSRDELRRIVVREAPETKEPT
jgi:mono/diheme cytochrome c family protein